MMDFILLSMKDFNIIYYAAFGPILLLLAVGAYYKNPNIFKASLAFTRGWFYFFIAYKVITINPVNGNYIGLAPTTVTLGQTLVFIISTIECLSNICDLITLFASNSRKPLKIISSTLPYVKLNSKIGTRY